MKDTTSKFGRRDLLKTAGVAGAASLVGLAPARSAPAAADKVRGIVFLVSDGMSPGVFSLAQAFSKLVRDKGTHWWELHQSAGSVHGLMDTASANSLVTDSAAASSAWGGGRRTHNGAINTTPEGESIEPIAAILKRKSRAMVGLVTTATVTHATPAGFAASVAARSREADIASQYLDRADVILGGGSGFFNPSGRPDKRDLRADFAKAGYDTVADRDGMLASRSPRLLGTFTTGHLPYTIDRDQDRNLAARVPTLDEMSRAALGRFLEADRPFLLQIEGARIDHAAHLNDIAALLWDQLAFDDALGTVLQMVAGHPDVLVVVTSDHGNANPGLNGMGGSYASSDRSFARIKAWRRSFELIFGDYRRLKEPDPVRLTSLIERNLGFSPKEQEVEALVRVFDRKSVTEWNHQHANPEGLLGQIAGNHTGIGWTGTTHTSDPTLITSYGPQAARFNGGVVNTDVFTHLAELLG